MLARLSAALHRASTLWTVVAATALYGYFLATVMPEHSAASRSYAGEWGAPDRQLWYTPDVFYREVGNWGDAGRADYVDFRLGLDIVWAFAYTAFLVTITGVALRRAFPQADRRRLMNLVPLLPMLCDYGENALGITLMSAYPARLDAVAWAAAGATALKWLTLVLAHVVMIYAIAAAARRRARARGSSGHW
jgi:hypothetical protein